MATSPQEQQRIDQYVRQKRVDIKWMNALKDVSTLFANRKFNPKLIRQWAEWFYRQAPPLISVAPKKVIKVSPKRLADARAKMASLRKTVLIKKTR